jgi:hypothetical protein
VYRVLTRGEGDPSCPEPWRWNPTPWHATFDEVLRTLKRLKRQDPNADYRIEEQEPLSEDAVQAREAVGPS